MIIRGSNFILRHWEEGDIGYLVKYVNNVDVTNFLGTKLFPNPFTEEDAKKFIGICKKENNPVTKFAASINDEAVGYIGLNIKEDIHCKTAGIGGWLARRYWDRGMALEALSLVTDYAFNSLGLERVEAGVFDGNKGSIRLLEEAGFRLEGRLMHSAYKNGRFLDEFIYGKLRQYQP